MQAQAAGTADAGKPSILQNPKFLVGLIVAAAVAIIIVIWQLLPKGETVAPPAGPGAGMSGSTAPGGVPEDPSAGVTGAPTAPGVGPGAAPTPGAAPMPGVAPAAAAAAPDQATTTTAPPPGGRKNPFAPTGELKKVIASIPIVVGPDDPTSPQQDLYAELYKPKPINTVDAGGGMDAGGGPPIPPMRVSAILQGAVTSAVLQIDQEFVQATPGKMIPDPAVGPFRVERIETGRVTLTRRWERGRIKGTQRFEVALGDGAPRAAVGGPGGAGGNGPGGFGGPQAGGNTPK